MNNEVNFEIAKLLKKKGFKEPLSSENKYWTSTGSSIQPYNWFNPEELVDYIDASTIAQVVMWLYEKQIDLCHIVNYKNSVRKYRMGIIYIKNNVIESTFIKDENTLDFVEFDSPTEAYLSAITHVLNDLI